MIIKKFAGVMLGAVIVLSLAVPAFATGVTIRAIENAFTPPTTSYTAVWDNTGATYLPTGYLVQIINAGANGVPDTPNTGAANFIGGDDTFITSVTVGTGTGGKAGSFSTTQGSIGGVTIYVRAWEGATFGASTRYGNSAVRAVPGAGSPPFNWDVPDFSTNLTIPVPAPTIGLSSSTFTFAGTVGGANPANQTLNISNTGAAGTTLNWSASDDAAWLTVGPPASGAILQGAAATAVPLAVNITGLAAGTYTGHITVTAAGASNTPQTVTVTLNVSAGGVATIGLSSSTFTFAAQEGAANPANQTLNISNTGAAGTTLNWSATDDAAWLTVGPPVSGAIAQGAAATAVPLAVNITGLTAAGSPYTGHITVTAPGASNTPQTVTVTLNITTTPPPATSVVIDDYEGTCVIPATGYYNTGMAGTGTPVPTMTRVTGAANLHEGTYGMNTTYAGGAASPNDWRGWGGVLTSAKNISATNTLSFWMKGDGSQNKVKIQFKDADGSNYGISDADAVSLTDTTWREYRIPLNRVTTQIAAGTISGLDAANITEYQFVFTGTAASTGVLIDYVMATTEIVSTDPQIISITPTSGPGGTQVTITGSNLDTSGTVQFATEGGVVTAVSSTATNTPITAWSADAISMRIPSMTNGSKNVKVVRASDLRESNTVTFEVTGAAASDSLTNAYPNPFNPLGGEVTRIVFSPGTATRADILIFDMTAKLVSKLNWPTTGTIRPDGRVEVTWDGKNSYGEIVGDGVYLYRVVDGGVRKGKILVVNKK